MRGIARQKLGYYPLAPREAERIRGFLAFPRRRRGCHRARPLRGNGSSGGDNYVRRESAPLWD